MSKVLYLTPEGKAQKLAFWEEQKARPRRKGPGFPDGRIIPLCDRLNELRGVCTLQSCAGHSGRAYVWMCRANLLLWLDEAMFWAFIYAAPSFANETCIENVHVIFGRYKDARAIIKIDFWGDEEGRAAFDRSTDLIYEHFRGLTDHVGM